jgi:hypothetical protein
MFTIAFPPNFKPKDFVQPEPQPSGDGSWYFIGYGSLNGGPVLCHVFRWISGETFTQVVPIEHPTTARGSLAIGPAGKRLWLVSYEQAGPRLLAQIVPGWTPPVWLVTE